MASNDRKNGRFTRRDFIRSAAAAAGAGMVGHAGARDDDSDGRKGRGEPHSEADMILFNGRIHTMDADNRVVSAVSIKDGRFLEVGSEARSPRGPRTRIVDLRGRTVVPGIIDNHNHIVLMGNRPGYHTPLENALSIDDVQKIYAARRATLPLPPDPLPNPKWEQWITTIGGFHPNHFYATANNPGGRLPTLTQLEAAVSDRPVFMMISFTGPGATNAMGQRRLRDAGVVVADDGSIAPGAQGCSLALLHLRQTLLTPSERRRAVMDAMNHAAQVGVTTHLDQGAFQATNTTADGAAHEDNYTMHIPFLEVYEQLAKDDKRMPRLRINFLHQEADPNTPELLQRLKNAFPFFGNDMVRTGGIGEFIAQWPPASSFAPAAKLVAQHNWRAEVHSLTRRTPAPITPTTPNGYNPADFDRELDGYTTANQAVPGIVGDRRWVIAHVPGITPDAIERMRNLGGGLSLTGWQYLAGNAPGNFVPPASYAGPPFRFIVDSGVHAGMSSDGMQIAPMNPWIHMYYATTGLNALGAPINKGQEITRQEVLSLYTRQNGWFLREEDQLGSIEQGKLADLVVLNSDYFNPSTDLKRIRSVLTVVDGQIIYDTGVVDTRRW